MDIKNTLLTSLRKLAQQHTKETLGDRSDYLGASEIGYCPRKVILEKINPTEHDLTALLRFERGHMAEEIIAKVFTAAGFTNFEQQVEILVDGDVPIKAHIDFVFTSETHKIKSVLEVKSTSKIPDDPYGSWESQIYLQMGALAEKYPDHKIRGAVIALDLANGEVAFYNGYNPQDMIFAGLKRKAEAIWSHYQAMRNGKDVELATEPDLLCGFCNHLITCPRFEAEDVPHLASIVDELRQLQQSEQQLKDKIAPCKQKIFAIVQQKGSIKSAGCILRKATRSRKHLIIDRLESFLADHGSSIGEFQEDRPFSFLEIKKAKAAKAA
jgi:CRISPR-associated exonuclease Cas4